MTSNQSINKMNKFNNKLIIKNKKYKNKKIQFNK